MTPVCQDGQVAYREVPSGSPRLESSSSGQFPEAFLEEVALALRPRLGKRVVRGRGLGTAPDSVSRLPPHGTSGMGTGSRAPFLPGHVLVRGARVSRPRVAGRAVAAACAAGAGGSVTRRRAERAEPEGRGGAESSAEQPLPAAAADPGPGPRPGSMDRSSLLQLIQEQVRAEVAGDGTAPAAALRPWVGRGNGLLRDPQPNLSLHDLSLLPKTQERASQSRALAAWQQAGACPQTLALPFQDR